MPLLQASRLSFSPVQNRRLHYPNSTPIRSVRRSPRKQVRQATVDEEWLSDIETEPTHPSPITQASDQTAVIETNNAFIRDPVGKEWIQGRAWYWCYGTQKQVLYKKQMDLGFQNRWMCNFCPQMYSPRTSANIKKHVRKTHNVVVDTSKESAATPADSHATQGSTTTKVNANHNHKKEALVAWLLFNQQPFSQVESIEFRNLLSAYSQSAHLQLPTSGDTAKNWAMQFFKEKKDELAQALTEIESKIHLSFDAWSAPNGLPLLGIVGHWVNKYGYFGRGLLGLKEIQGRHTGVVTSLTCIWLIGVGTCRLCNANHQ